MKVKYIDKRHWRRLLDRDYIEVKVNNNKFKGIIGLITINKVREPLEVTVIGKKMVVADEQYQWLQIVPEKKRYSLTVMFNEDGQPLQYYFDINLKNITQKGKVRTVDLYLDVLVLPDGRYELVDQEDLERALRAKKITRKQYHEAYIIAHQLMIQIDEDFQSIHEKAMYCFNKIRHKHLKHERSGRY
ncbi:MULTISPECIES: DUF402 domain-containing protein [unclassified Staphylococcus]|uniref:DUF402 domain-containing protein n=1 Tax=unclassified Staphylococcus TaxID=91994 RepID=UPI0021D2ACD2|nr:MULTISPECIES: DUF402 domain-containing protein [unclassified Staphylococcus]UXR78689.1 DUF402 domain-containing protein [Staphylococcus sp. IVB6227]UXR82848.1 DUF402 domain-containing protein [Staphylococcus sp. IVB6214]